MSGKLFPFSKLTEKNNFSRLEIDQTFFNTLQDSLGTLRTYICRYLQAICRYRLWLHLFIIVQIFCSFFLSVFLQQTTFILKKAFFAGSEQLITKTVCNLEDYLRIYCKYYKLVSEGIIIKLHWKSFTGWSLIDKRCECRLKPTLTNV